ncbi:Hypothetical predicted protein [Mytilus galloprovincialis]|nr:Hypothetical predicted protein [Mytilus galloprovincialis]
MLKEGYLKKKLSLLKGYRDQWFVVTDNGYLKYFIEKPVHENQKPKGQMLLLLSDINGKSDHVSFKVKSANNNVFRLRAESREKRKEWMKAIIEAKTKMDNRMFRGFYDIGEMNKDQDHDDTESNYTPELETVDADGRATETDVSSLFKTPKKPFVAVAAIDFGTTYSGCAFSTVQDFKTNPVKIETIALDETNVISYKTPTVLLLTPEGQFHSFGAKAEEEYVNLAEKDEATKWYYFNRFKMQLYKAKELKSDMVIKEMGGKTMKAMMVFAFCIEYIKDKVLERLSQAINGLDEDDVHWVLTVPAIWNDQARQFMIAASEKAGIGKDNLTLALEPEGAAMFCKYLALEKKMHGDETELKAFEENARFMVVDLGGKNF